ncbi:hypothetical protein NLX67_16050 [Domibacillus sp. A3M-37]|uniref:hypothetical protein n=1 Tax=Domibacillus sp. A3M-37 TaxID=2962037 RepID=UPI0020B82B88|nr:hypothetical protein [Domibacillus sp. A3M-37]MCP3763885.1 hypothetical protein [Domibacillus sp. A3M-37]
MNFETKYLIRWGIPGWVFILFSYVTYISYENTTFLGTEFTVPQLLGILISLGFVGIVLGYLMHQIYFSLNWIFSKQSSKIMSKIIALIDDEDDLGIRKHEFDHHRAYFTFEFYWQKQLLLIPEDKRNYIAERHRYLLTTIHGLGALVVSLGLSLISVGVIIFRHELNWFTFAIIFILGYLFFSVFQGFRYYSDNLIHFQANFINSFVKKELKEEKLRERIEIKEQK